MDKHTKAKSRGRLGFLFFLLLCTAAAGALALMPAAEQPAGSVKKEALPKTEVLPGANAAPVVSKASPADNQNAVAVSPPLDAAPKDPPAAAAPTATPATSNTPALPYYLYLEKESYTLTIYEADENGEYTKVYKTYRVAHGGNKTPAGTFTLGGTKRWHEFPDGGFVQYAVKYHNRLYMHSPLYGSENGGHLWPKYYDGELGIGKSSTGGCIRMVTEAARFIYENCPEGTIFEVVNGAPKGTTSEEPPSRNGKRVDPTDVNMK